MELVGIADVVSDYRLQVASGHGLTIHAARPAAHAAMRAVGIAVAGG